MDIQKIGNYIKCKRKAQGLTQAELAGLLGITNKAVSKWENGKCLPDLSLHEKLCDALHITLNELVAGLMPSTQLKHMTSDASQFIFGVSEGVSIGITLIGIAWLIFGAVKFSQKEE